MKNQSAAINVISAEKPCSIPCNLCGSVIVEELSLVDRDNRYLRTVICRECGLAWTDPRPEKEDMRRYYSKDYRLKYKGTFEPRMKHIYRAGHVVLSRYERVRDYLKSGMKTLDVGAGGGEFVYRLKTLGHDASGIEPNEGYAGYAIKEYGVNVQVGFIQDAELDDASFDFITIFHVLEHAEDPLSVLQKLRSWIKPGGTIVVEVPNIEAVCQAPVHRFHLAHIYSFNESTLVHMGRRAGLDAVEVKFSPDRGNITVFFRRADSGMDKPFEGGISGNCEHVLEVVNKHTSFVHFTSSYPYVRFFNKLRRIIDEGLSVGKFTSGKQILDDIFKSA